MRRLYVRVYLALLTSLIVFALLAALAAGLFRLADSTPREPWSETGAEIAERLLPADRDPAALSSDLAFWSEHTGFSLAMLSSKGAVIAEAGDIPRRILDELTRHPPHGHIWHRPGGAYGLTLKDGRILIAAPSRPGFDPIRFLRFPATFLGLALAIAVGFYPLIRYLMRRLERLEAGVARFGAGDLSARVPVRGRDEIAKLASTFNQSADRIESLMMTHRKLLAHASHELRSPLSRLRMAVERLKSGAGGEAAQAEAAHNIAELDALVDEILLASRLQAGSAMLNREDVDLAGLLAEECATCGAQLEVALSSAQSLPIIQGDPRLLRRLFRNLLENAAAHGGPAAPEVLLTGQDDEIRVLVCDRGPGISEDEREKIFEPFYQARGRAQGGGAGLGLTLVREIATKHGGVVRCLPRDGGGTCFEVVLPNK